MSRTRDGAPPCSGPDRAPTAADRHAATSAPVEATTRTVKVEAFMPCSAAEIQYASIALTWAGSASPRQRIRKRSGIDVALSISRCGTGGRQARLERTVDEQPPYQLERDLADELFDVDAAIAQCRALLVGLRDLGGEGEDALQAGLNFGHAGS